jgi:hypothetical protein
MIFEEDFFFSFSGLPFDQRKFESVESKPLKLILKSIVPDDYNNNI